MKIIKTSGYKKDSQKKILKIHKNNEKEILENIVEIELIEIDDRHYGEG